MYNKDIFGSVGDDTQTYYTHTSSTIGKTFIVFWSVTPNNSQLFTCAGGDYSHDLRFLEKKWLISIVIEEVKWRETLDIVGRFMKWRLSFRTYCVHFKSD